MQVLIIGSGGREHALAWKALQSPLVSKVFVAPGNAGTAREANTQNVNIDVMDFAALKEFAKTNNIGLTIVGPEAPLVGGIVNKFEAEGLKIYVPRQGAAQLEGSKAFTKDFLARHNIPTAFDESSTEVEPALAYINKIGAAGVIEADGKAAGKAIIVSDTIGREEEASIDTIS